MLSRCCQTSAEFCFLKKRETRLFMKQYTYWKEEYVLTLPTIISPYLLRVIPTLIWCSSVRNPKFSSNHDLSGCTWSSFLISASGWERTVDRITIPYSSPACTDMRCDGLTCLVHACFHLPWLSVIVATVTPACLSEPVNLASVAKSLILDFWLVYGVRRAIWLRATLYTSWRTFAIFICQIISHSNLSYVRIISWSLTTCLASAGLHLDLFGWFSSWPTMSQNTMGYFGLLGHIESLVSGFVRSITDRAVWSWFS